MGETFRASMTWLHTWSGVVMGGLLFAIFWMGTLSVFDKEIDRWMMPDTRLAADTSRTASLDTFLPRVGAELDPQAQRWWLRFPGARVPFSEFWYMDAAGQWQGPFYLDPVSGKRIADGVQHTLGGSEFIYPFHYRLHLQWLDLGYWLVGLAAMAMLVLLVSGVVIHRKIFVDFFTFRWQRKLPRSSLDLHNLAGVLGLPFHFVITLSGLIIFFNVYFPATADLVYAESENPHQAFQADLGEEFSRPAADLPGELASLDEMARAAEKYWNGARIGFMDVFHPGDAASRVGVYRANNDTVTVGPGALFFDGTTGERLHSSATAPVSAVHKFISGLHLIQFDHWPLRWLYFVLGLSGCVMIATGYVYWLETRRKRHAKLGLPGVRIVEGLTIGSVTGIVIATLAFFVVNRLLPPDAIFANYERAALEVWVFYLCWLASFAHAWLRPGLAWREQCWAITSLATLAVALNGITTGDHLIKTIMAGYWPVAGMDSLLLAGALMAAWAGRKLASRSATAGARVPAQVSAADGTSA